MKSKVRKNALGGCLLYLFFGLFAAAGTGLFVFITVLPLYNLYQARSWLEVPCRINSSEVEASHSDDGATYRVAITYSYDYGGVTYDGDRYDFSFGSSSGYDAKARVVAAYPPDEETVCYVDPEAPHQSVINRSPGGYLWWGLFPLPFMAVGYGGLIGILFVGRRRSDRAERLTDRARSSYAAAAPSAHGPTQVLEPRYGRIAKLLGITLVALFWNGIVSVFVFGVIVPSFRDGDPEWFPTIFMVPFALVGLGLIGAVVHQFLALFNPILHIELGDGHLTPGESCHVRWWFEGNARRIRRLTIVFEGRESATYRRGTDSVTDHHTFYSEELVATEHPGAIPRGSATLRIPERTMPSFKSSNNAIAWRVTAHGDVPNWPDVDVEYPVSVHPSAPGSHP